MNDFINKYCMVRTYGDGYGEGCGSGDGSGDGHWQLKKL